MLMHLDCILSKRIISFLLGNRRFTPTFPATSVLSGFMPNPPFFFYNEKKERPRSPNFAVISLQQGEVKDA